MEKVEAFKCEHCHKLFSDEEQAGRHESLLCVFNPTNISNDTYTIQGDTNEVILLTEYENPWE